MIGGGVHMGETSVSCIEREIFEEAGISAHVVHLAVVCENFFKGIGGQTDNLDCHTIEFYFCMDVNENGFNFCRDKTDVGEELVWLSIEEIKHNVIKPTFIRERINEIISKKTIIHIIEERDR